jgi:ABC-type long-subunit fatty acid transport system fused permease/ATPase subunit
VGNSLERKIYIQEPVRHDVHYIGLRGTPHRLNRPASQARLFGLRVESNGASCLCAVLYTLVYFLPIWFQASKGASAWKSGAMLISLLLSMIVTSIVTGILVTVFGYHVPAVIASVSFHVDQRGFAHHVSDDDRPF